MNNRMQLDLRARIDELISQSWVVASRSPLTLTRVGTRYSYKLSPGGLLVME